MGGGDQWLLYSRTDGVDDDLLTRGVPHCIAGDRSLVRLHADYLLEIAAGYPAADTIHLVMDNLSTHTRKALRERFGEKAGGWLWNRFTIHYTPKHGSWLNQAEMEVSLFSRQCLGKRRIGNIAALRQQARAWNRRVNHANATIQWKFTRRHARRTLHYTITRSKH